MALVDFNRRRENDRRINQDREAKASTTSGIPAGESQQFIKNISTGNTIASKKTTLYSGPTTGNTSFKVPQAETKAKPKKPSVGEKVKGAVDNAVKNVTTKINDARVQKELHDRYSKNPRIDNDMDFLFKKSATKIKK